MISVPTAQQLPLSSFSLFPLNRRLAFTRMGPLFFQPDKMAFVLQSVYFTSLTPPLSCGADFIMLAESESSSGTHL